MQYITMVRYIAVGIGLAMISFGCGNSAGTHSGTDAQRTGNVNRIVNFQGSIRKINEIPIRSGQVTALISEVTALAMVSGGSAAEVISNLSSRVSYECSPDENINCLFKLLE